MSERRVNVRVSAVHKPPIDRPILIARPMEPRYGSLLRRTLRYLAPYLRARWKMAAGAAGAVLAGTAVDLLKPWPLKFVFDYLLKDISFLPQWSLPSGSDSRMWLLFVCAFIVLISVLSSFSSYFKEYLLYRLAEEVVFRASSGTDWPHSTAVSYGCLLPSTIAAESAMC
jgi:hypothetical protein